MSGITLTADMPVLPNWEWDAEVRKNPRLVNVKHVPQTMFCVVSERQAKANHFQTLERLRERGGLSATEMIAVLSCCEWEQVGKLSRETAHRVLYAMVAIHNRGMRIAEQRAGLPNLSTHREPTA